MYLSHIKTTFRKIHEKATSHVLFENGMGEFLRSNNLDTGQSSNAIRYHI